jgi:oxepin-CoA hydrolase/3-oxo-5,6-dehydrosuberyl-CoA semialdehyde dehydrogenase
MAALQSYLEGRWQAGSGPGTALVDPSTEETLGSASAASLDRGAALRHARAVGGPALRAQSFAQRGAALAALAKAIHARREALIELSIAHAGSTRGDAKFDLDGATGTLAAYAALAAELPTSAHLPDGPALQLGRSPRFVGQHVRVARRGVAVHVNAFNFPAWGQCEKLACALLAGMPVLEKPGTPTAAVAEAVARAIVESGALPEGAYSFLCGEAGDLLDHVGPQDVVAFTGSSATARGLRAHRAFVEHGARLNVEADSLNAAVLGPDVQPGSEAFDLFVRDVQREMTQKSGQKCTATRRVLVPQASVGAVVEALVEGLAAIKVGDPRDESHRMGPVTSASQLADVQAGIRRLASAGQVATGGADRLGSRGYFLRPTLVVGRDAHAPVFHAEEVFGPVASVLPWSGDPAEAAALVAAGGGSLVTSVYSDDRRWPAELALELAPWSGRVYLGSARMAEHGTGPGVALPSLVHGGPGRAGGGEELGGLRGLHLYMQRTAVQGFTALIEGALGAAGAAGPTGARPSPA